MTHLLKTWPGEFEAVRRGDKWHEVRKSDRNFQQGDSLILAEWNPAVFEAEMQSRPDMPKEDAERKAFTGRKLLRVVGYVTKAGSWGLPKDVCVFSLR